MIELIDTRKVFNVGKPNEFTAVHDVSLCIPSSRVTVLKGPSGSGKTTLLSLVGCMARPTSGRIMLSSVRLHSPLWEFSGGEVSSLPERFLTEIRRHTFGFIFQQYHLIRGLSALENVMLPAYPRGEPYGILKRRAMALLDQFGIGGKAASRMEWLSGGEAQRLAIARALINDPQAIIADEPTAHLDSRLSEELMAILLGLRDQGKTVIIASHDPIVCDSQRVDGVVELRDGRVVSTT